jgi:hypothetical protein
MDLYFLEHGAPYTGGDDRLTTPRPHGRIADLTYHQTRHLQMLDEQTRLQAHAQRIKSRERRLRA